MHDPKRIWVKVRVMVMVDRSVNITASKLKRS